METAKIWTSLTSLFVVVGIIFCWLYLEQVDRANEKLMGARAVLESTRSSLEAKKQSLEKRQAQHLESQKAGATLQKAKDDFAAAEAMLRDAQAKERDVRREIRQLINEATEIVSSRRSNAGQKEYPSVELVSGKVYQAAKVRKVEDDGVSFIHAGGIGVAKVAELPESILVEFDLGPGSIVAQLRELEARCDSKPGATEVVEIAPVAQVPAPSSGPSEMSANDRIKLKNAQGVLVDLQTKLSVAHSNQQVLVQQANLAAEAVANAQFRGVPTTNYRLAQQKAAGAVVASNTYIAQLNAEITKVQLRIAELQKSY